MSEPTDDWVEQFLRDCAENAARKERGEPTTPVFYSYREGQMQRVEHLDVEGLVRRAKRADRRR
jgi:hypothetical protein